MDQQDPTTDAASDVGRLMAEEQWSSEPGPLLSPEEEDVGDEQTADYSAIQAFLALWSALLEDEPHAIAVLHRETFALFYRNPACRDLFGDFSPQAFKDAIPAAALEHIDAGHHWTGTAPTDGPCVVLPILGADGAVEGLYVTWIVPQRSKKARQRDVIRQVLDHGSDLIIGLDQQQRIVYRNELARHFYPREILGQHAQDVLQGSAANAIDGRPTTPEPVIDSAGKERVLQWRGVDVVVESTVDGNPRPLRAVLVVGRDVTREHEASVEIQLRVRRIEAMHAISLAIGRGLALPEVYELAMDRLLEVISCRQIKLFRVEDDRSLRGVFARDGNNAGPLNETYALANHPGGEAVNRRVPVQRHSAGPAALRWPILRQAADAGIHAVLSAPLMVDDEVVGVLWLATPRSGGFSPDDIEAAEEVAAQLANAIARQELMDEIARYARELEQRVERRTNELKNTQQQLLHAAKLSTIGEMSSGLAHELNQPLNVLSGYIELLQEGDLDGPSAARALDVMEKAAERMASLVVHLRNFSRDELMLEPVDLREVVDMARDLSSRASKRPVTVRYTKPPEPVKVVGDANRLEQLVINLLANAMQATEQEGGTQVDVSVARHTSGQAIIEVADQGPGVPGGLKEQIFEPFFTTKERGLGTGLGLSISSKIVQEHGGEIVVDNLETGGALFRVTFPLPGH